MPSVTRYQPHGPFHAALKERVDDYFVRTRKAPQHAPIMTFKTVIIFGWLIASYLYALLLATTWWQVALAAISIGLSMAGVGFNVQHDGGHRAYSARAGLNAIAAGALDFIGGSSYVWSWKHNIFHHANPNRDGLDTDIDIQPLCRLSPQQRRRPWHRFQHLYVWFLYSMLALKWVLEDFRDIINGTIGGQHFPRPRGWNLVQLFGGKVFFLGWSLVLPALLHPVLNVVGAWLLASVATSLVMALIFQMAHVVEHAAFPTAAGASERCWAAHQVATTADFGQGSTLLTWFTGSLNFQIEHHLFPRVCHVHLPALAPIVKATCQEFGVPYFAYPTAHEALASHVRWLRAMGEPCASVESKAQLPTAS